MAAIVSPTPRRSSSYDDKKGSDAEVVHQDVLPSAEGLVQALAVEKPKLWTRSLIQLYCYCVVAFLCSTMNGVDSRFPPLCDPVSPLLMRGRL